MSIDTGFDPTRGATSSDRPSPSTSLKEEPVPHLDVRNDDVGESPAPPVVEHAQPVEGDRPAAPGDEPFDLHARARDADAKVRKLVEENPLRALAAAAIAGFALGRIVR
ncbi:MAG TPA: hypothetical protein VGO62_15195 [Myxococcota bacterium]|jgi:hypothetical protein